jgi:hypothetical protein
MNTNHLKKFAQEARRKLIQQIGARMELVLTTDSAELREKIGQLKKLQEAINRSSKEQVIDKVAYTWFNRLMALRFMDANDFQPIGIRVVTPKDGYTLPEILDEAKQGHIPEDLPTKKQHIYDLLDGKIPSSNAQNEAYKELLIAACNHLNKVLPFLFERIDDYAELLLPDDLTSEFSIVQDIRNGMSTEDCKEVEIIGWLYQFYISEKKDEVFASKSKVKKEDIPAATQLFTPRWIVEYMVQNTLGKLWLQNKPNSRLRDHMPYFIESPSVTSTDYLKVNSVEEITLLDQACGSGHILVYAFELFTKIYEEEGYNATEIPQLIIEKNLFGFEIDERAAQLAGMALMMKARSYQRRLFKKDIKPNILCYSDLSLNIEEIKETFHQIGLKISDVLFSDLEHMQEATNLGSLIIPKATTLELETTLAMLNGNANTSDAFLNHNLKQLQEAIDQLLKLDRKYHCIVDNPPYMGGGKMNTELSDWVKVNYPKSKADLMVCFMERAQYQVYENGFVGMINLPSWMFLSSFEDYRKELNAEYSIDSLLHLGRGIFGSDFGSVAFTFIKQNKTKRNTVGVYRRLFQEHVKVRAVEKIRSNFLDKSYGHYTFIQKDFEEIPGSPLGYWLNKSTLNSLINSKSLIDFGKAVKGLDTCDNDRFVRYWCEIGYLHFSSRKSKEAKWFIYNKGGEFRKWYGNDEKAVNWEDDGQKLRNFKNHDGSQKSRPQNIRKYFSPGITWSSIGSGETSYRYMDNSIFGGGGNGFFPNSNDIKKILGFLNSKVSKYFLDLFNPTLNNLTGDLHKLPIESLSDEIEDIVADAVNISKAYWETLEENWAFKKNQLTHFKSQYLEETYDFYQEFWKNKFFQLHKNEEELNRQFIDIYGLQEELTPDVPLKDITILKEETKIVNGELVFQADEIMAQFVSYAVGCMFGRYSLDKEGLILANQGETLSDYIAKVQSSKFEVKSEADLSFIPDDDNIIPVLDDEWFEDDITGRFYAFLKVSFGKENFEKNLAFVEDSLGKDIRKYFVKDFYKDHIKRYKKRPIYWMFSSPKGSFNVLIYLHRYTPDALNEILNNYLKEYREKLSVRMEQLDHQIETGSSSEQTQASKEKDKMRIILLELQEYERDILYPLATERIAIDLDDGVLVNYNKFGTAIKPIAGLNDAKTKKKVRGFDWIDNTLIR